MSETPTPQQSEADADVVPVVAAPSVAPVAAPLCYVVDEEPSIRHFLSLVLHGAGIDTNEFADGAALRAAIEKRAPALIFHNVSLESADAIKSVVALGKRGYSGAIQLMSNRGAAVLAHVRGIGEQHKLNMLPVLKKPFETEVIVNILHALKLGMPATVASRIDLDEALNNNWIEFWYQPKIDLRRKQLVGAEAYARARHPQHGIVLPDAFTPGASDAALNKLAELALTSVLQAGLAFSRLGINLQLAVNIPVPALVKLPVVDFVKMHQPIPDNWAGLIIDVPEEQIITNLAIAGELAKKLAPFNVQLALDEFGQSHSMLARLEELPFAELKLARAYVIDCSVDKSNAPLCRTVIDLAHGFGRKAVAMGIEKASDAIALVSMGCDFGQGFLLGQPMPEQRFVSLLHQRAATQGRQLSAAP
jgi:EAL domain-containing protein (putative c-di-GMP-specific phosphodiesterase class I)